MLHPRTHRTIRSSIAIASLLAAATLSSCGGSDDAGDAEPAATESATAETTPADTAATEPEPAPVDDAPTITIADFAFGEPITVAAGTEVTVTNADQATHTLTATDDSFDTGNLAGGASATITLSTPGEFTFFCAIHPTMSGSITVEA